MKVEDGIHGKRKGTGGREEGHKEASRGVDMIKVYEIHALLGHEPHYLVQ